MSAWWDGLTELQKFLYCIAVPSTIVMLIQTILMLAGLGGHDAGAGPIDGGVGHDVPHGAVVGGHSAFGGHGFAAHGAGDTGTAGHEAQSSGARTAALEQADAAVFHLFSIRSILAFLVVFGWVGVAMAADGTISAAVLLLVSFVAGVGALFLTAWMFYGIQKLQASGNIRLANAVGREAEVYIPIPGDSKGSGKVNLLLQGRWIECDAVTRGLETLRTRQAVKVVGMQGESVLVVEPIRK